MIAMLEAVGCLGESEKAPRLAVRFANEVLPAVSVVLVADEEDGGVAEVGTSVIGASFNGERSFRFPR